MEKLDRINSYFYIPVLLIFLFTFPFWLLPFLISFTFEFDLSSFLKVLYTSFIQSFLSAFLSILFSLPFALSLISHQSSWIRYLLLSPQFLPPLFVILSLIHFFELISFFPFGFLGVLISHVFIYLGFSSVLISYWIKTRAMFILENSLIFGASFFQTMKQVFFYLYKEIAFLFLLIFSVCFTSYSYPLIIGGESGKTLEILAFEKIKIYGQFEEAFWISVFQILIIVILSLFLNSKNFSFKKTDLRINFNQKKYLAYALSLFYLISLSAFFLPLLKASSWNFPEVFLEKLPYFSFFSFLLGLLVGLLVFLLLSLILFCFSHPLIPVFFKSYMLPSYVLIGFCFILLPFSSFEMNLVKTSLGLSLIFSSLFYRFYLHSFLSRFSFQMECAKIFGASLWKRFRFILFPQCLRFLSISSGICAFWACFDFSLSSILIDNRKLLSLQIKDLISHYRLEQGSLLSILLLFIGFLLFFIFKKGGECLESKI